MEHSCREELNRKNEIERKSKLKMIPSCIGDMLVRKPNVQAMNKIDIDSNVKIRGHSM